MSRVKTMAPSVKRRAPAVTTRANQLRLHRNADLTAFRPRVCDSATLSYPRGYISPDGSSNRLYQVKRLQIRRILLCGLRVLAKRQFSASREGVPVPMGSVSFIPGTWDVRKVARGVEVL